MQLGLFGLCFVLTPQTNAGKLHILTPFFEHLAEYDMLYAVSGKALQWLVQ
jgi:hypothetical protein